MGRVFSHQDLAGNRLPSETAFIDVEQYLSGLLAESGNHQLGALIFGSAGYKTSSVRSDFDYLLTYPVDQKRRAQKLAREVNQYARERFVVTDPYLASHERLRSGRHTVGESFLNHLKLMEDLGRSIGQFRVSLIQEPQAAGPEFMDYVIHKLEWLNDWLSIGWETESDRLRGLQKILEMPAHVIRRYLAIQGLWVDQKATAIEAYRLQVDHRSHRLFEILTGNDQHYTHIVKSFSAETDTERYEDELLEIEKSAVSLQVWLQRHLPKA